MDNIEFGIINYDSTQAPFFRKSIDSDKRQHNSENILNVENLNLIDKFKSLKLPKNIEDFFINNNAYNSEIYLNNYTFLSINKILELYEFYNNDNIKNIIDLGFIYIGMGHIDVIYYNSKFNKIFFRNDGGSNGYDRLQHYNEMNEVSKIDNINSIDKVYYDFDELLEKINTEHIYNEF